jgi:hypothetical protein
MHRFSLVSRTSLRTTVFLLGWCCAVLGATLPAAGQDALQIESAQIGFNGVYKAGFWTQILVHLQAGPAGAQGRLDLLTEDGDGVPVIFPAAEAGQIDLAPNATAQVRLYAKAGPQRSGWQLQLRREDEDRVLWSQPLDVPAPQKATRELLVTLGLKSSLDEAVKLVKRPEEVALMATSMDDAAQLPDRVWGYEGVERLLLAGSPDGIVSQLSTDQWAALRQWVLLGGKLILAPGEQAETWLAPDQPLAPFAPGRFDSLDPLRETSGLAGYAGVEFPRRSLTDGRRPPVIRFQNRTGRVELDQGGPATNPPLVLRQMHGFGQVIFIAFQLDHPTLAEWKGNSRLLARVIQVGGPPADNLAAARSHSITHLGYEDLIGQLRSTLDQFPGVTVVSFTAVALVAVFLLLLIGPADYFALTYLNWPRAVTWITFPLLCLLFAGGTWYLGLLAHGDKTRINQVDLVDLDVETGLVRGTVWNHLYSPTGRNVQLSLRVAGAGERYQQVEGVVDWQGLPGAGLGGLSSPQVTLDASSPYLISPPGRVAVIHGLPVRTASSKSLSARWWGQTELLGDVTPLSVSSYGHLDGELVNPLPVELTECLLASGEWLYRIESFKPGQKIQLSSLPPLNLESRLTRRQVIDTKDLSTPWNPTDTDLQRIMHMLMLHDAVHGPKYTGMSHRLQPQLDLSEHVRSNRAVLMGQAKEPAASLPIEGQIDVRLEPRTFTWYRLVIPVQPRESSVAKAAASAAMATISTSSTSQP